MSEEAEANTPESSEQNVKVEIVVQPPLTVGVRRRLIPPVIARTDHPQLLDDYLAGRKSVFGTAMLTASNGADMSAILDGNYNVQGQPVTVHPESSGKNGGGSSSRQEPHRWIYFIFTGLSIPVPGVYTFTVCVNALVPDQGCVLTVGGKASRSFTVVDQAVAPARPSKLIEIPVELNRLGRLLTGIRSFRAASPADAGDIQPLQPKCLIDSSLLYFGCSALCVVFGVSLRFSVGLRLVALGVGTRTSKTEKKIDCVRHLHLTWHMGRMPGKTGDGQRWSFHARSASAILCQTSGYGQKSYP